MNDLILAIDIGTTHCKAICFDKNLTPIHSQSLEYSIVSNHPGWQEQDPQVVFKSVVSLIQQSLLKAGTSPVKAISFSAAMHSLMVVDAEGNPLTPALTWADTRSKLYAEKILQNKESGFIYQRTGTPIHPMSPLCKIMWIKNEQPEIFKKANKFISIKEYVFYRLFGKFLIDYSIASATGLFDIYELIWLPEAIEMAGITNDLLSTPVPPTHAESILLPEYQDLFQLSNAIPFFLGANDGCLANLGCGAIEEGDVALSIGTSGAIRMVNKKIKTDTKQRVFNYLLTEKLFITGGPINNGGIALQWIGELFEPSGDKNLPDFENLIQLAATVPAGAGNLLFLPYLLGERAPMWDANAKGVFFGLSLLHQKAHFIRAVIEGICFAMYDIMNVLEETNGPIKTIYASGGLLQSPFCLQLLSDMFGKEIILNTTADASATGAAFMGMYALGWIKDLNEIKNKLSYEKRYQADAITHQKYQTLHPIFQALYPKLKTAFFDLSLLENNDITH